MLSPEAVELKAWLQEFEAKSAEAAQISFDEARKFALTYTDMTTPSTDTDWDWVEIGDVRAQWADAEGADQGTVVLFLHGGGFATGDADSYRHYAGHLSRVTGSRVLNVDYRLAPERPFPGPVEDAIAAYEWVLDQGYAPDRIVLAGNSAGANLALAVQLHLLQKEMPSPAAIIALSALADLTLTATSFETNADKDRIASRDGLAGMKAAYLGGAGDPRDPLASPVFGSLTGSAPLYLAVGGDEVLLDDTLALASNARRDEVEHVLDVAPHMHHDYGAAVGRVPESSALFERIGAWTRLQLQRHR